MKIFMLISSALYISTARFKGFTQIKPATAINKKMIAKDEFSKKLFTALQNNNEALWLSLYPTEAGFKTMFQQMFRAKVQGLTIEKMDEFMKQRNAELLAVYKKELHDLLARAADTGVVWCNSQYQTC